MPRKRNAENRGLPCRWQHTHGAYYYQVPSGQEVAWDDKKKFRLGATLPDAYRVWSERIGGKFAASPIYADGRIYFFDRAGLATVIKPGRELKVLATNKLEDGFMASPAVSGKALYLRTLTNLYRVESAVPETE